VYKKAKEKLIKYNPQQHTIAIYTSSYELAHQIAQKLQLTSRQWFYVRNIHDLFGRHNLYLIFYGDFFNREDFDEVWEYWKRFMPPDCHHYLLEYGVEEYHEQP